MSITKNIPKIPKGYRLITPEDRSSVSGLSGWLPVYPEILRKARRWNGSEWSKPGYRFFWDDMIYVVPEEVEACTGGEREYIEELDK